jgi:hypothetical protein
LVTFYGPASAVQVDPTEKDEAVEVCSSQTLIKRERDVGVTRLMQEVAQGVMRGTGQPKPVMLHP